MSARTTMTTGWRIRLGGIAILFAGMGLWFLYDGMIGYPGQQAIADEFIVFRAAHQETNDNWQDEWDKVVETKGYPPIKWEKPESTWYEGMQHSSGEIMFQTALGVIVLPFAAWFGFLWFKSGKRWIESDDTGVHNESGHRANWENMVKLDKRRWPKKGIAVLHFMDDAEAAAKAREAGLSDDGAASAAADTKRITMDDWKYEPAPTKQIIMAIEEHLDAKLIIGDITEAERDAKKKAAAEADTDATEGGDTSESSDSSDAEDAEAVTTDKPV